VITNREFLTAVLIVAMIGILGGYLYTLYGPIDESKPRDLRGMLLASSLFLIYGFYLLIILRWRCPQLTASYYLWRWLVLLIGTMIAVGILYGFLKPDVTLLPLALGYLVVPWILGHPPVQWSKARPRQLGLRVIHNVRLQEGPVGPGFYPREMA